MEDPANMDDTSRMEYPDGVEEVTTTRSDSPSLTVEFLGTDHTVKPPSTLAFGRAADICVDDNPSLHRVVGVFFWHDGLWYLSNRSTSLTLQLVDADSASSMLIAPGASASLGFRSGALRFSVGTANYSLDLTTSRPPAPPAVADTVNAEPTLGVDALPLTPEQHVLVLALAEPTLRNGVPSPLPTNREVATRLGWSTTKFNRKLDSVCQKLADGGVPGLIGTVDQLARDRRQRLVDHAVNTSLVSADDLGLLDAYRR